MLASAVGTAGDRFHDSRWVCPAGRPAGQAAHLQVQQLRHCTLGIGLQLLDCLDVLLPHHVISPC